MEEEDFQKESEQTGSRLNFQQPSISVVTTGFSSSALSFPSDSCTSTGVSSCSSNTASSSSSSSKGIKSVPEETKVWDGQTKYGEFVKGHTYPLTLLPHSFWTRPRSFVCASCSLSYQDTLPVPVPCKMDMKQKCFEVLAITCSLSCCMRYSLSNPDVANVNASLCSCFWVLAYQWNPLTAPVRPAPERIRLSMFWTGSDSDARAIETETFRTKERVCPTSWNLPTDWTIKWKAVHAFEVLVPYTFTTQLDRIHVSNDKSELSEFRDRAKIESKATLHSTMPPLPPPLPPSLVTTSTSASSRTLSALDQLLRAKEANTS